MANEIVTRPNATWTYREVADRSAAVKAELARRKIGMHRDSALSKVLKEAEALAADWDAGVDGGGMRRLMAAANANRIAEAILAVCDEPEAEECLRRMADKDMNLSSRSPSSGKDALWELDLLAYLRRKQMQVNLREPDLVVKLGDIDYPIACKKVYSEKGVEAQMRKGVAQIAPFGGVGLVAFNIDDLVPADSVMQGRNVDESADFLAGLNTQFLDRHRRKIGRFVTEGRCDGILVSTSVVADVATSNPRLVNYLQMVLWTETEAASEVHARLELFSATLRVTVV